MTVFRLATGALLALLMSSAIGAEGVVYEKGTHYEALPMPIKTATAGKIEVTEYFSYGCPHCFTFDPMITAWKNQLPDDVVFNRTPAIWNKDYQVFAQTYYTAQAMKVGEQMHGPLFVAIHEQRRRLSDPQKMAAFFAEFGVDPVDFAKVYNSFGVRASMQQAEARGRAYRSGGVPALIINGKYRVEGGMAGSNANMLRITDFLINQEREAASAAAALNGGPAGSAR